MLVVRIKIVDNKHEKMTKRGFVAPLNSCLLSMTTQTSYLKTLNQKQRVQYFVIYHYLACEKYFSVIYEFHVP